MNIQSIGSRTRTTAAVWTASLAVGALTLAACASGVTADGAPRRRGPDDHPPLAGRARAG